MAERATLVATKPPETKVDDRPLEERIKAKIPTKCVSVLACESQGFWAFVYEIESHMRVTPMHGADGGKAEALFSWPSTIWISFVRKQKIIHNGDPVLVQAGMFLAATKEPWEVKKRDTELFYLPMPNISPSYMPNLCMGTFGAVGPVASKRWDDPGELSEFAVSWALGNSRWGGTLVGFYKTWHDESAKDPEYYKKLVLNPLVGGGGSANFLKTVGSALEYIRNNGNIFGVRLK